MKHSLPTGYTLHFNRLESIEKDGDSIKTHKYKLELKDYNCQELWNSFEKIGDAVDSSREGSLLYFIFRLINLGFVFSEKPGNIPEKQKKLAIPLQNPFEEALQDNYIAIYNVDKFIDFLKQGASKSANIENELRNIFQKYLAPIYLGKEVKLEDIDDLDNDELKNVYYRFVQYRKNIDKKIGKEDKIQIFSEFYGLNFQELLHAVPKLEETFFLQHLSLDELKKERSYQDVVLDRMFPLAAQLGIKQKGDIIVKEILGAPNGWSRLLNINLPEFQKSPGHVRNTLLKVDKEYFESHTSELEFLSHTIHQEAIKVHSPELDFISQKWSNYRQILQGRVQGWLSNFVSRLEEYPQVVEDNQNVYTYFQNLDSSIQDFFKVVVDMSLFQNMQLAQEIGKDLSQMIDSQEYTEEFSQLLEQYNYITQDIAEKLEKFTREPLPDVETVLQTKQQLIQFQNLNIPKDVDLTNIIRKDKETGHTLLKMGRKNDTLQIPSILPKYPRFIGETKEDIEQQLIHVRTDLEKIFHESQIFFQDISKNLEPIEEDEVLLRKKLASIIRVYQRSHPQFQNQLLPILRNFISSEELGYVFHNEKVVYQSAYARRKKEQVNVSGSLSDLMYELSVLLKFEESSFVSFFEISSQGMSSYMISKISLLKIYWSIKIFGIQSYESISLDNLSHYEWLRVSKVGRFLAEALSLQQVLRLLQAGYGSELNGKASQLTKQYYTERIVIQNSGSDDKGQSYLMYVPFEFGELSTLKPEIEEFEQLKGRFDLTEWQKTRRKELKKLIKRNRKRIQRKGSRCDFTPEIKDIVYEKYGQISNYEIVQHIWSKKHKISSQEKEILRQIPHRWYIMNESQQEFSQGTIVTNEDFILNKKEETIRVSPNVMGYAFPVLTHGHQLQFFDKFLRQDFSLDVVMQGASLIFERDQHIIWTDTMPQVSTDDNSYALFLALPWELKKEKNSQSKELRKTDWYLGVDLGEYGIGWAVIDKESAEFVDSGFVEFPILKKLRDEADSWKLRQAQGTFSTATTKLARIRENAVGQIRNHIHALALHYNAMPVYEKEVDAFETGGNKIKKLYKSLKVSDVYAETEADNMMKKRVWGNQYGMIGAEVGAYLTSQTCRHCGRCATQAVYHLAENNQIKIVDNHIHGSDIYVDKYDGWYPVKDIWKQVKYSQRTSSDTGRGNQDVFICQYSDCGHTYNADEQAAHNIAFKKYVYEKYGKTREDYLIKSLEYASRNT